MADDCPELKIPPSGIKYNRRRYVYALNISKSQYVRLNRQPKDRWDLQICPLPLLCADGNGRGGGDYRKEDDFVGYWKGDLILVRSTKREIPPGYTEITPVFIDD